jgi:amylosucrase
MRVKQEQKLYGVFNFSQERVYISWFVVKEHGIPPKILFDHWHQIQYEVGSDEEYLMLDPYSFYLMEAE